MRDELMLERMTWPAVRAVAENGGLDHPQGMSASMGRRCIEAYVDLAVSHFLEEG